MTVTGFLVMFMLLTGFLSHVPIPCTCSPLPTYYMDVSYSQGAAEDYSTSLDDLEGANQIDLYGQSLCVTFRKCKTERNRKCDLKVKNWVFFFTCKRSQ